MIFILKRALHYYKDKLLTYYHLLCSHTFPVGNKCGSILRWWPGLQHFLLLLLIRWTGWGVIQSCQVWLCQCSLCPAVETVGPIDHLSPTSRFKALSPEQGMRGRELYEVGWGNQLCVAIKLSFLSPSNGLPFPWFWAAWSCWSVCKAPSLTLSLSYLW